MSYIIGVSTPILPERKPYVPYIGVWGHPYLCEPVSRKTSVRSASRGSPFTSKMVVYGHTCDFAHTVNETLKWLTQLPTLMLSHSGGDNVTSKC